MATTFHDWVGNPVAVDDETVIAALAALGVHASSEEDCAAALLEHDRRYWSRALAPVIVTRSGVEASFWVHVIHGAPAEVWVRLEDGTIRGGIRQADNFTLRSIWTAVSSVRPPSCCRLTSRWGITGCTCGRGPRSSTPG